MRFDVITLFPEVFSPFLSSGVTRRAFESRLVDVRLWPLRDHPELGEVDADFEQLFYSWFNRGFLQLRPIDWHTPAVVLEKIIRYEAVHEISGWGDLRRRLDPPDRKCFAFVIDEFHQTGGGIDAHDFERVGPVPAASVLNIL